jgi:SAM-dependent methyltransferase
LLFDEEFYLTINKARWDAAYKLIKSVDKGFKTCLDLGCGPGWFTERLAALGPFSVTGVDGREDLITQAKKRVPNATFMLADLERDIDVDAINQADLVFCFGLLYHLENPFRATRKLYQLTRQVLLLETQIIPRSEPIAWLVEEGRNETQGLNYIALIPTRSCLSKMLIAAGFSYVYEYTGAVDHPDFYDTAHRHRRRAIFVASAASLDLPRLSPVPVISAPKYNFSRACTEPLD